MNLHARRRWWSPISTLLRRNTTLQEESADETDSTRSSKENHKNRRVRPNMIRRMDDKPKLVNPSGRISEGRMPTAQHGGNLADSGSTKSGSSIRESEPVQSQPSVQQPNDSEPEPESELEEINDVPRRGRLNRRVSNSGALPHRKPLLYGLAFSLTPPTVSPSLSHHLPLYPPQPRSPSVTRTQTVEFAPSPQLRGRHQTRPSVDRGIKRQPSVAESRIQHGVSDGEGHVEVASKSSCVVGCRI